MSYEMKDREIKNVDSRVDEFKDNPPIRKFFVDLDKEKKEIGYADLEDWQSKDKDENFKVGFVKRRLMVLIIKLNNLRGYLLGMKGYFKFKADMIKQGYRIRRGLLRSLKDIWWKNLTRKVQVHQLHNEVRR